MFLFGSFENLEYASFRFSQKLNVRINLKQNIFQYIPSREFFQSGSSSYLNPERNTDMTKVSDAFYNFSWQKQHKKVDTKREAH
jgi:hypothetical protein